MRQINEIITEKTLPLKSLEAMIFPDGYKLVSTVRQKYELELAAAEARSLTAEEIIRRGAYFESIGGVYTNHYWIAEATPVQVSQDASDTRKRFFEANKFAVAYATHGLFPYRGKFHPQMIKAILNIIRIRPGDTVLDPMVGSGTTCVEATIVGVNSIGVELNPFTKFMAHVKTNALSMDTRGFDVLRRNYLEIFDYFHRDKAIGEVCEVLEANPALRELVLLSYLDTLGYAKRRKGKTARELFPGLLKRYLEAVESFVKIRDQIGLELGKTKIVKADARDLPIENESVDGIVFSPPYSFAIDYVENDRIQLDYLGVDIPKLKQQMVGLRHSDPGERGRKLMLSKLELYFEDMEIILRECFRVLKNGKYCVIVVGSNTVQTGGISLENELIRTAEGIGFALEYHMTRDIEGIRNTMKEEHLLFLRKG